MDGGRYYTLKTLSGNQVNNALDGAGTYLMICKCSSFYLG